MYNLEPLKGYELTTCTPFNVGPSTYTIADTSYVRKNVVPFLSSAIRSRPLKSNVDVFYDTPILRSKIKYGNSLQFTTARETIDLPGNFERNDFDSPPKLPRVKKTKWKKNTGRLFQCRMPFSDGPGTPSIPTHADANGYDINYRNALVKNPPDDIDLTIGPAFYDVPRGELNFNSQRYGGCAWSKTTDKRLKTASFEGPGPGYYDVNFNFCGHRHDDDVSREPMRKCCGAPRYTCELICLAKRENIPGPGAYKTVNLDELGKIQCLSLKPRPFIDSQERFVVKRAVGPGPQDYSACDCVMLRKNFGVKNVPFLNSAQRFKAGTGKPSPGPGWYPTPSGMAEKLLAKRSAVTVPFGSKDERKWTFQEVPLDTPASVDYDIKDPVCCPTECPHESSVFQSRVCRFKWKKPDYLPEVASYNTIKDFHFIRNRESHSKRGKPFDSTEEKFLPVNDFCNPIYENTPAVGKYDIGKTLVLDKSMQFSNNPRFPKPRPCYPGPGYYSLRPEHGESLNRTKTTHNARLMKEVKRNYCDARIPKARVKAPQPTGKKLLRWFIRPPEQRPC